MLLGKWKWKVHEVKFFSLYDVVSVIQSNGSSFTIDTWRSRVLGRTDTSDRVTSKKYDSYDDTLKYFHLVIETNNSLSTSLERYRRKI